MIKKLKGHCIVVSLRELEFREEIIEKLEED